MRSKTGFSLLQYLLVGFLIGGIFLVGFTVVIILSRPTNPAVIFAGITPSPTHTPRPSSTVKISPIPSKRVELATSTPSPFGEFQSIFDQAEWYISRGEPSKAEDLINPLISKMYSNDVLAEAYRLLGYAEESKGLLRFAAGYYQKMVDYDPSVDHMLTLAKAYEAGGEWSKAYKVYGRLLNMEEASSYRSWISERIQYIKETCLCTPIP